MGAAQQLVVVKQRPMGAELSALVDRLRRAEKRQAELEMQHAPTAKELEALRVEVVGLRAALED